jgi:hypothetical protein
LFGTISIWIFVAMDSSALTRALCSDRFFCLKISFLPWIDMAVQTAAIRRDYISFVV